MPEFPYVLNRSLNEITFAVDYVEPGEERFPTTSLWTRVEKMTERSLRVTSHPSNFLVVEDGGHHALLSAVHLAFSQHLPLALTPDAIWLTIEQGFAQHVNNHAEELRPLLVNHQGKMRLQAEVLQLDSQEDWTCAVDQWTQQIEAHTTPEIHDTLLCDFSTTTPIIRTASQIVMMEAFHLYFDYVIICVCGIPKITLYGTVEDWRTIRARVERLAPYGLAWWTDRLLLLCDAFIATAEGRPPRGFWQRIYKPKEAYGGDRITGWIADLFPYIRSGNGAPKVVNPMLRIPRPELKAEDGLRIESFPNGLSSVAVTLQIGEPPVSKVALEFLGGFFGVTQNPQTGCLQAEVGWGVQAQNAFTDSLEKFARDHALGLPRYALRFDHLNETTIPREIIQMLDHFDGGKLFAETAHPWRLRRWSSYTLHDLSPEDYIRFMDLPDGRSIGFTYPYFWKRKEGFWERTGEDPHLLKRECWIVMGRLEPDPENGSQQIMPKEKTVVIATSLPQFFERVLQAEGRYYFDSPDFLRDAFPVQSIPCRRP